MTVGVFTGRCPTGNDPSTAADETDCANVVAEGGFATGATHNLCHVDCSNRVSRLQVQHLTQTYIITDCCLPLYLCTWIIITRAHVTGPQASAVATSDTMVQRVAVLMQ